MLHINTFHEWRTYMVENTPHEQVVTCPDCGGEGVISDECECCGNETETECDCCEGLGELQFCELRESQRNNVFNHKGYLDAVKADLIAYAEWTNKDSTELFVANGFTVYMSIYNKELIIKDVS